MPAKTVFSRLKFVIDDFTEEDLSLCLALSEMRNLELHTGALPFADLSTGKWIAKSTTWSPSYPFSFSSHTLHSNLAGQ